MYARYRVVGGGQTRQQRYRLSWPAPAAPAAWPGLVAAVEFSRVPSGHLGGHWPPVTSAAAQAAHTRCRQSSRVMYARLTLYSLLACCWAAHLLGTNAAAALLLLSYLVTGGNYTLYLLYHTAGRDARGAWRYLQLLILVYVYQKRNLTVSQVFQRTVKKHPNKVALYFEDESWTFKQVTVNRFFPQSV